MWRSNLVVPLLQTSRMICQHAQFPPPPPPLSACRLPFTAFRSPRFHVCRRRKRRMIPDLTWPDLAGPRYVVKTHRCRPSAWWFKDSSSDCRSAKSQLTDPGGFHASSANNRAFCKLDPRNGHFNAQEELPASPCSAVEVECRRLARSLSRPANSSSWVSLRKLMKLATRDY